MRKDMLKVIGKLVSRKDIQISEIRIMIPRPWQLSFDFRERYFQGLCSTLRIFNVVMSRLFRSH